jgi:hypothetical protein
MTSAVTANLQAHGRDLRIDLVRGIALWLIVVDHIPGNAVNLVTLRNFGFSGAADLLIFVTGYAAAIRYGRTTLERGFVVATSRIYRRVGKLYAAYLVLFVTYISAISWLAARYDAPDIIAQYHVIGVVSDTLGVLMDGLFLLAHPLNLDILQLLITLLAFFPFALACLLRWPNWTLAGSIALYFAARRFDLGLPEYSQPPDSYLNPLCWQALFTLGAWLALNGRKFAGWMQRSDAMRILAMGYLLFALLISLAETHPTIGHLVPDLPTRPFIPNDRVNLAPYRLLHLLALALVFTSLVPEKWQGLRWRALQPLLRCGEEWLACFCTGVFLSFAGYMLLITSRNSLLMQVLVSAAAISIMTAFAYYISWSKRQDQIVRLGTGP